MGKPLSARVDYSTYMPIARRYLELERQMTELRKEEKAIRNRLYGVANELAHISYQQLGFLGHTVVDQMREEQNAERARTDKSDEEVTEEA